MYVDSILPYVVIKSYLFVLLCSIYYFVIVNVVSCVVGRLGYALVSEIMSNMCHVMLLVCHYVITNLLHNLCDTKLTISLLLLYN